MASAHEHLETECLRLRRFVESDWDPLHALFGDAESVRYTLGQPFQCWQTWRMIATYMGHWQMRGYGPYAVIRNHDQAFVGTVGLWFPDEWPEPELNWSLLRTE